ncbi:unnamed protein product, partial [Symbiodinium sp. KB8]
AVTEGLAGDPAMELMKAWLVSMVLMFGLQAAGVSDEPMLQSLLGSVEPAEINASESDWSEEEKRQWYRERAAGKEYYELNNNPSLSVDEVAPLYSKSRAEVNQVFAAHAKLCGESKGDRPCRCSSHPRPHRHKVCPIDVAVKLPVAMGTLQVVQRAQESLPVAEWAKGTSLTWLPP